MERGGGVGGRARGGTLTISSPSKAPDSFTSNSRNFCRAYLITSAFEVQKEEIE